MTARNELLRDELLREALVGLADGPDATALVADVLEAVDATPQGWRLGWPLLVPRRAMAVGLVAVLVLALLAVVLAFGALRPRPIGYGDATAVVQVSNGLRAGDLRVVHTAFAPGAETGAVAMTTLPPNAVGLRWSPSGERLAYFEEFAPPTEHVLNLTALILADADGSNRISAVLPHPMNDYVSNGWWAGVRWAPAGNRLALVWTTHMCTGGPSCIPPSGIDVIGGSGQTIASIETPDNADLSLFWSPDGRAIGWMTSACVFNACNAVAFNWRLVDGGPVTTLPLSDDANSVVWSTDGRLLVIGMRFTNDGLTAAWTVTRAYTMDRSGSSFAEVRLPDLPSSSLTTWSPDGARIAAIERPTGTLVILDVAAGRTTRASLPEGLDIAAWAPDGQSLMLYGGTASETAGYGLYRVSADGRGLMFLGDGDDFGWRPPPVAP